jgi:hypothetical protein
MVLLLIASHETEDRGAFPAVETLAHEARCSVRSVQYAIRSAEAAGELSIRQGEGPHGTNLYRVLVGLSTKVSPGSPQPGVQNLRGADTRRESAPNSKELSSGSRVVVDSTDLDSDLDLKAAFAASTTTTTLDTNPNQPTHDQLDLARKLAAAWGQELTPAAIVKLNKAHGRGNVEDALRSLRGFPPEEAVRKLYAYVAQIAADTAEVRSA